MARHAPVIVRDHVARFDSKRKAAKANPAQQAEQTGSLFVPFQRKEPAMDRKTFSAGAVLLMAVIVALGMIAYIGGIASQV